MKKRAKRNRYKALPRNKKIIYWAFSLLLAGGLVFYLAAYTPAGNNPNFPAPLDGSAPAKYDLVVVGSDPEGIAAALSAARNGLQVLLVDRRDRPGGLFTLGWLNTLDMNYDRGGNLLTRGIFSEFLQQIEGISFDVQTAQRVFDAMLAAEDSLALRLGTEITGVEVAGGRVRSLNLAGGERLAAQRFIDATQDGDLAYLAGASFSVGMEDMGTSRRQAVTLVLEVGGVDWPEVVKTLNSPTRERQYSGATGTSAWGFLEEMRAYRSLDPQIRSRGLNMGRQNNGNILINAMHIFEVDGLDPSSRRAAKERGRREAEHMVRYMRETLPGFGDAYLAATAPELYVRETRHLQGLYRLTIDDVLEHRDFWDKIALGSYPVDIQATAMDDWGDVIGNPAVYSIPFRCLVPRELHNLLVVGRAASYDALAHGSARVVPLGMVVGEAAGAAAALSLERDVDFHQLSADRELVAVLQERLQEQGAYLPDFEVPHAMEGHPLYPVIRELRAWGLVNGGYNNDYRLEEEAELRSVCRIVGGYLERVLQGRYRANYLSDERQPAHVDDLRRVLAGIEGAEHLQEEMETLLQKYGIAAVERPLLRREIFCLLLEFLQKLE
ncbi:MAG: FAD-dependent oxidoreductase [Bacillota bacterium]